MDFQFRRYDHTPNNITMEVFAVYTPEEFEALTRSGAAIQPCIDKIYPTIGFWAGEAKVWNPTFLQLSDPGIHIEGFTGYFAQEFQNTFNYWYGDTIRANLAPILQWYRREVHQQLSYQRDQYFGAAPQLPYAPSRQRLR